MGCLQSCIPECYYFLFGGKVGLLVEPPGVNVPPDEVLGKFDDPGTELFGVPGCAGVPVFGVVVDGVDVLSCIGDDGCVVLPGSVDERFMPGSALGFVVDSGSVLDGVVVDVPGVIVGRVPGAVAGCEAPGSVDGWMVLPGTVAGCVVPVCVLVPGDVAGCVVAPGVTLDGDELGVLVCAKAAVAPNVINANTLIFKVFMTIYFLVVDINLITCWSLDVKQPCQKRK